MKVKNTTLDNLQSQDCAMLIPTFQDAVKARRAAKEQAVIVDEN